MKYIDEYREAESVGRLASVIDMTAKRPSAIMEVCGGQTHAIMRFGIEKLLPDKITLLHGPGCPVCVTPVELIDKAVETASRQGVIFCSFGDMLRVPGSGKNLLSVKAEGGDVRIVYSPLDALKIAVENPDMEVVFFAIGFETTAPANGMAVYSARLRGIGNFSILVSQFLIPPAIEAVLSAEGCRVEGLLAPGHVCAVTGWVEYERIAERYGVPIAVTGFEPLDIMTGIYSCVKRLESGVSGVENCYPRAVRREGNPAAQRIIREVFRIVPRNWRGIGVIPGSGLGLAEEYADFDAENRFGAASRVNGEPEACISGDVLRGLKRPDECPSFAELCTPEHPLGATMVSSEGACSAYYKYNITAKLKASSR